MKEIVHTKEDGKHWLKGFYGVVSRRVQPGVYVPSQLKYICHPKNPNTGEPATRMHVEIRGAPDKWYIANVTRVCVDQRIVGVPIENHTPDPRFPPGTECFVRFATDEDEA